MPFPALLGTLFLQDKAAPMFIEHLRRAGDELLASHFAVEADANITGGELALRGCLPPRDAPRTLIVKRRHEVAAPPEQAGRDERRAPFRRSRAADLSYLCPDSRHYLLQKILIYNRTLSSYFWMTAPKDTRLNERTLGHDEMPHLVQAPRYAGRQGRSARREALRGRVHG